MAKQSPDASPPPDEMPEAPLSQAKEKPARRSWFKKPTFMRDFPHLRMPPADENFELVSQQDLQDILASASPEIKEEILQDIEALHQELLNFFKERDRQASFQQNRYRLFQLGYTVLALMAMVAGAGQAMALNTSWLVWLGFLETVIALVAVALTQIGGTEPPLETWIQNRRIAEFLRQEYFRYLMRVEPYDAVPDRAKRRMLLARRAAEINQGKNPDQPVAQSAGGGA